MWIEFMDLLVDAQQIVTAEICRRTELQGQQLIHRLAERLRIGGHHVPLEADPRRPAEWTAAPPVADHNAL